MEPNTSPEGAPEGAAETAATASAGPEETEQKERPLSRFRWSNLSYTVRVTLSFALVAAFTSLTAIAVVSFVWGNYFESYTKNNMQSISQTAASRIAAIYENTGRLDPEAVRVVAQAAEVNPDVGVKVLDVDGNVVYETEGRVSDSSSFEPTDPARLAISRIEVNRTAVGSVRLWVYGSDRLMSQLDEQFRDNSYNALIVASLVAVLAATLMGFVFARGLVAPINRLTRTAAAVKAGKLDARSNLRGGDEIAHLGETFDAMIESVERDRKFERRVTSDVAHELRTPLMSIQASVEAMIDGVYDADDEHLEMVDSEVKRLSRLVDALLKLSRLENRTQPIKHEVIDLGDLVREVVATHEQFVTDSGLTLSCSVAGRVLVMGDGDMIRQAVVNLISNAVRYTPEGGKIRVAVRRSTAMASIIVSDTGIGLSPEDAKMVFSRFWRADAGRARESGGLGIGLSVVKEIVDRHNGWVNAEGEEGKGATFTINLPLYEDVVARVKNRTVRWHGPRRPDAPSAGAGDVGANGNHRRNQ